jgi:hypothetical protein
VCLYRDARVLLAAYVPSPWDEVQAAMLKSEKEKTPSSANRFARKREEYFTIFPVFTNGRNSTGVACREMAWGVPLPTSLRKVIDVVKRDVHTMNELSAALATPDQDPLLVQR